MTKPKIRKSVAYRVLGTWKWVHLRSSFGARVGEASVTLRDRRRRREELEEVLRQGVASWLDMSEKESQMCIYVYYNFDKFLM